MKTQKKQPQLTLKKIRKAHDLFLKNNSGLRSKRIANARR